MLKAKDIFILNVHPTPACGSKVHSNHEEVQLTQPHLTSVISPIQHLTIPTVAIRDPSTTNQTNNSKTTKDAKLQPLGLQKLEKEESQWGQWLHPGSPQHELEAYSLAVQPPVTSSAPELLQHHSEWKHYLP